MSDLFPTPKKCKSTQEKSPERYELLRCRDSFLDIILNFHGLRISETDESKKLLDFSFFDQENKLRKVFFVEYDTRREITSKQNEQGSIFVFSSLFHKRPIIPCMVTFTTDELLHNVFLHDMVDYHYREAQWRKANIVLEYETHCLPKRKLQDICIRCLFIYQKGEVILTIQKGEHSIKEFFIVTS